MNWRILTEEEAAALPEARLGGALLWLVVAASVVCLVALMGSTLAFDRLRELTLRYMLAVGFVTIWSLAFLAMTILHWRGTPLVASAGLLIWIGARVGIVLAQGALSWTLLRDTADPALWVEHIVDETWLDHLRRFDRLTAADDDLRARRYALHVGDEPPRVTRRVAWPAPRG